MRIEENDTIIESLNDIIKTNSNVMCACGDSNLTHISHIDGGDTHTHIYNCKCGNVIIITCKRKD